jgi:hypothetical protein
MISDKTHEAVCAVAGKRDKALLTIDELAVAAIRSRKGVKGLKQVLAAIREVAADAP